MRSKRKDCKQDCEENRILQTDAAQDFSLEDNLNDHEVRAVTQTYRLH